MNAKGDEDLKKKLHEALTHYFFALTGDNESLAWLLTHEEQNLRDLGQMMIDKQKAQPQRQIGDGYESSSDAYMQE